MEISDANDTENGSKIRGYSPLLSSSSSSLRNNVGGYVRSDPRPRAPPIIPSFASPLARNPRSVSSFGALTTPPATGGGKKYQPQQFSGPRHPSYPYSSPYFPYPSYPPYSPNAYYQCHSPYLASSYQYYPTYYPPLLPYAPGAFNTPALDPPGLSETKIRESKVQAVPLAPPSITQTCDPLHHPSFIDCNNDVTDEFERSKATVNCHIKIPHPSLAAQDQGKDSLLLPNPRVQTQPTFNYGEEFIYREDYEIIQTKLIPNSDQIALTLQS
ncbi:uncharacterized protein N7483_005869 [Penicillium malachiteum]|uniref:uncharacterized protein n=1 Tax=Penicillium malachiteum TaxID=1324776 RepID=UPI002548EB90|nr:uncharacterized protein N7483_005869 [Penicillium malachiteum]KAJ5731361.1 hypothetical protein N7483_005869 [Penicillium malachiteum]